MEGAKSVEHLKELVSIAEQHANPEVAGWLRDGVQRYLADRKRPSLEESLGLSSPGRGKPEPRRKYARAERDRLIKEAFKLIDPESRNATRCEELAKEIRDFESRIWPNWKDKDDPPANCTEVRRLLFLAMKTGEKLPSQLRTVWETVFDF